jgi:hypothetical protein
MLGAAGLALSAEYGTREEAKAMLDKVVAELKVDRVPEALRAACCS